jgi:ABC-2 type transport system ATP-binding protein
MSIIQVKNLCKNFSIAQRQSGFWNGFISVFSRKTQIKTALNQISFEVNAGELIGYIGPNGAGKSTTIKILSGILVPTKGEVQVLGKTPWKNRIETVRQIGVVFGQRTQLWWDLPVIESFELLKEIYKVPAHEYKNTLDSLVEILNISQLLPIPVRQLSLGQRMRCDLAAALLHQPKLLFLDEPTIGLDAVSKLNVRNMIKRLNREYQVTILITTHDMDDIESLCKRVLILNNGEIVFDGPLSGFCKNISSERWLIIDLLKEHEKISDNQAKFLKKEGSRIQLSFDPQQVAAADLISRIASKYKIRDLYVQNPPIEEIIAKFYRSMTP